MGAINYKTSNYITLGIEPPSIFDLEKDADFIEEIRENYNLLPEEDTAEAINDYIDICMEDDFYNAEAIRGKYSFYYYHVVIKCGYYEGFYIDIESNFPIFFDNYEEKQEAQKEITQIKQFLTECAGIGFVSVFPGWCTSYKDYAGTIADINEAIKEMREEAKATPTYTQYFREA